MCVSVYDSSDERIVEFALYLSKIQLKAIDNYENDLFTNGAFDNIAMLKNEVLEP